MQVTFFDKDFSAQNYIQAKLFLYASYFSKVLMHHIKR